MMGIIMYCMVVLDWICVCLRHQAGCFDLAAPGVLVNHLLWHCYRVDHLQKRTKRKSSEWAKLSAKRKLDKSSSGQTAAKNDSSLYFASFPMFSGFLGFRSVELGDAIAIVGL